jgi:hypothetical protein
MLQRGGRQPAPHLEQVLRAVLLLGQHPGVEVGGVVCWLAVAVRGHQEEHQLLARQPLLRLVVLDVHDVDDGGVAVALLELGAELLGEALGGAGLGAVENPDHARVLLRLRRRRRRRGVHLHRDLAAALAAGAALAPQQQQQQRADQQQRAGNRQQQRRAGAAAQHDDLLHALGARAMGRSGPGREGPGIARCRTSGEREALKPAHERRGPLCARGATGMNRAGAGPWRASRPPRVPVAWR